MKSILSIFSTILFLSITSFAQAQILGLAPTLATNNVSEASQYGVVYQLDIPATATNYATQSAIAYALDKSGASGVSFKRVAYFLQLDNTWVWASMDKFNNSIDLEDLGIPAGNSSKYFQQIVTNLHVFGSAGSNVTNISADGTNGNVEIWPNCYGTQNGLSTIGGNNNTYDFNDSRSGSGGCYGSFQVHNYGASQTIFGFNAWTNSTIPDLGIGNSSGSNPDWTFMHNANSYSTRKLYILVDYGFNVTTPSTASQTLCINNTPSILSVSGSTISGTTIKKYEWYINTSNSTSNGTLVATHVSSANTDTLTPSKTSAGTLYYYVVMTNSANATVTSSSTASVTINSLPTIGAISGTTTLCNTKTSQLSNTTSNGVWKSLNSSVATINSTGLVTTVSAGTSTIRYTVTNASGCVDSISTTVTVNSLPTVSIGQTGTLTSCTSGNIVLTASGANTYLWNNSSTTSKQNVNVGGTYSVTGTDLNGCSNTASVSITNFSYPVTISALGLTSMCSDTPSLNLRWRVTNNNSIDVPYTWTVSSTTGNNTATANTQTFFSTPRSAGTTLVLNYYDQNCALQSVTKASGLSACNPNITGSTVSSTCSLSNGSVSINVAGGALPYTYLWSNGATTQNLTNLASGNYSVKVTANTGAYSNASFTVTNTTSPTASTTNVSVCDNYLPYTWNGTNYSGAGTYTKKFTNSVGCDSIATLVLSLKKRDTSLNYVTVCSNQLPYTWNGVAYNTSGTYTFTLANANQAGCDSIAVLILTVNATSTSTTNVSVCTSQLPYSWNGKSYNTTGTYSKTFTNAVGCDSIATLVLTVNAPSTSTINASICAGGSYLFNGTTYTSAGTYSYKTTNSVGCDSTATLILSVNALPIITIVGDSTACSNDTLTATGATTYVWSGGNSINTDQNVFSNTGLYTVTGTDANGCSNSASINVSILNQLSGSLSVVNATCTQNGSISVTNFQGPNATSFINTNFSGTPSNAVISGSTVISNNECVLTPANSGQTGYLAFNTLASNPLAFVAQFDYRCADGSGADGTSFNYGKLANLNGLYEYGTNVGLAVKFIEWQGSNSRVVLTYNGSDIATTYFSLINTSYRTVIINVSATGLVSVTIGGTAVITNAQLPAAYSTDSKSSWQYFFAARCGGASNRHSLKNLSIGGQIVEYSKDGTNWQSSPTFSVPSGNYNIYARINKNGVPCSGVLIGTTTVTMPNGPTVTVSGNTTACVSTTLTASGASTYSWNGGSSVNTASNSFTTSGNYSVTGTDASGCKTSVTTGVTINANPTVAAITGLNNVCVGGSVTLNNATSGGVWSSSNTAAATIDATTGILTASASGTTTIYYTVTNSNNCSTTVSFPFTVNAYPTVNAISGTAILCANTTTSLANSTSGGVWTINNASLASINSASGFVTGITAGIDTVNYTVTSNGCATTVSKEITINATPVVPAITGNNEVCINKVIALSDTALNGVWSSGSTSIATISPLGVVTGLANGTSIISYTVVNAVGCTTIVTKSITVNALPVVSGITQPGMFGNGLNLDGVNDYVITPNLYNQMPTNDATVEVWFKPTAAGIIIDELGQSGINQGWHDSQIEILSNGEVKVSVWSLSPVSLGTVSFGTWNHAVVRYNSSTNKLDGLLNGVASTKSTIQTRSRTNAQYYAFGAADGTNMGSGAYFKGSIDEVRIWKTARTNAEIQSAMNSELAGNETGLVAYYNFNQGVAGGTNSSINTLIDKTSNGNTATLQNFALTGATSNWVTGASSSGNSSTLGQVCLGSTLQLSNTTSGGIWSSLDTTIATINSTGLVYGKGIGSTTINYTITNSSNCSTTASTSVTVNALPTATISGSTTVCQNASSPSITFTGANTTAPYTFSYTINGGPIQTVTTTSGNSVTVSAPTGTSGSFVYTLVGVKDASSTTCSNTASGTATVTVNPLPTATINGTTAVCQNSTNPIITFTGATGTAPYTINYKINNGATQTIVTTGNTATIAAPTTTAGTFLYTLVSVQDASSTTCLNSVSGSATITVNPLPTAIIAGTTTVCQNTTSPNITFTGSLGTAPYTFVYTIMVVLHKPL